MRAISLWQPWASAMAVIRHNGTVRPLKRIETRSWSPVADAIGERLAICASKSHKPRDRAGEVYDLRAWWLERVKRDPLYRASFEAAGFTDWETLPFGAVVCHGVLNRVVPTEQLAGEIDDVERAWGDYSPGRFGWELTDLVILPRPVPIVGRQGIFLWDEQQAA